MAMSNLLSVLIPTYNRPNLLKICLASVLQQTYKNIEIIVIDDASNTSVRPIIDKFNDDRITLITNTENIGSKMGDREHFRRFVYEIMKGEYFIYITDDDYWPDPNFLERAVKYFEQYPNISSVQGSQMSEFFEDESSLITMSKLEVESIIKNNNKKHKNDFYYFNDLFKTGYINGMEYLDKFSENATSYNISITASVRRRSHCIENKYLKALTPSKWQGGYEYNIVPTLRNDIFFINEPCVVARIHKNNASFRYTQFEHFMDSIQSILNSFENISHFNFTKEKFNQIERIKKKFIRSLSIAYIHNSLTILRGKTLSLTSKENNKRYVTVKDILKIYLSNNIKILKKEYYLFCIYYLIKFRNLFRNKNYL